MSDGSGVRKTPIDWEDWQGMPEGTKWNAYQWLREHAGNLADALSFMCNAVDPAQSEETNDWEIIDVRWRGKIDEMQAEVVRLQTALRDVQWRTISGGMKQSAYPTCVGCGVKSYSGSFIPSHKDDCPIETVLRPKAVKAVEADTGTCDRCGSETSGVCCTTCNSIEIQEQAEANPYKE